jgi:hypothetical protein
MGVMRFFNSEGLLCTPFLPIVPSERSRLFPLPLRLAYFYLRSFICAVDSFEDAMVHLNYGKVGVNQQGLKIGGRLLIFRKKAVKKKRRPAGMKFGPANLILVYL